MSCLLEVPAPRYFSPKARATGARVQRMITRVWVIVCSLVGKDTMPDLQLSAIKEGMQGVQW